jgi:hypothetical protein
MSAIHVLEGKILLSEENQETDILRAIAAAASAPAWRLMSKSEKWKELWRVERAVWRAMAIARNEGGL